METNQKPTENKTQTLPRIQSVSTNATSTASNKSESSFNDSWVNSQSFSDACCSIFDGPVIHSDDLAQQKPYIPFTGNKHRISIDKMNNQSFQNISFKDPMFKKSIDPNEKWELFSESNTSNDLINEEMKEMETPTNSNNKNNWQEFDEDDNVSISDFVGIIPFKVQNTQDKIIPKNRASTYYQVDYLM